MRTHVAVVAGLLAGLASAGAADEFSLAGSWRFRLDRADAGEREQWFTQTLPERIALPGDLAERGIGDRPSLETKWIGGVQNPKWFTDPVLARYATADNFKFPYWLTPERHYVGAAWFQRDVDIPAEWAGRRVVLTLERPHWETRVWVDGKSFGRNDALGTPHDYDLGQISPGRHVLAIRVDNRLIVDVGVNSHSISDHTQGNWNGIVGRIALRTTPLVWIVDLQVYPDAATRSVRVRGLLGNSTGRTVRADVALALVEQGGAPRGAAKLTVDCSGAMTSFEAQVTSDTPVARWDEFSQRLYELTATIGEGASRDTGTVTCGFRDITTNGTQFLVNGRKTFLRGTLECAIFPRTGHPPTDVESWERIVRVAKEHGLNHLRFHSWCPPEAAFIAADRLGMYLHVECSSWANQSTTLGDGKPVDAWLYAEADRILQYRGNHPSFVLMLYGNEPGGKKHSEYLARWVAHYRERDPRRLYSSGAGWPQIAENQFHVTPDPRVQRWGEGLKSRINAQPPETTTDYRDYIGQRTVPVISHEIGQWCVYPNFDEIPKYTGYLKARNFEIFRDTLAAHHMADQARSFLLASGKLQTLCYKEDIEAALRTRGMGGFQLLDLHDFPGQGTALVGVLDPFWEEKGYVTAADYRRFCNATVPLARLPKRVFTTAETLQAELEIAHFGPKPLERAVATWKLVDERGAVVAHGDFPARDIAVDNGIGLGQVRVELRDLHAPARYKLVAGIANSRFENDWNIWVYPAKLDDTAPSGITVAEELDDATVKTLAAGGRVLLAIAPRRVAPDPKLGRVGLGFSSIFWNTAWTNRQPPHTLGVLVDPRHPLFAEFPTEFHSDWQWWYLVSRAGAMILDELPPSLRPAVQVIDDWVTNRKLGLVFEAKVGAGRLLMCSIDVQHELDADPVRRQFRHALLRYMAAERFDPRTSVSAEQVRSLFARPSKLGQSGITRVSTDSEESGTEAESALDGDPQTFWHTAWRSGAAKFPHHLEVEYRAPRLIRGFTAVPRQDGNRNGLIREYAFYASEDGRSWGEPVAQGSFEPTARAQTVMFVQPVRARFFRLVARSSFTRHASLAELMLLEAGK